MEFLVDAQLPPALARMLVAAGHSARHVADIGWKAACDSEVWDLANSSGAVLVTKDEDFARRHMQNPSRSPVIVWLRVPNTSRRALLTWFGALLPRLVGLVDAGERLIELR